MERQAPRQVLYENQLPLAVESKSTRRLFFPEGGSTYGPTGGGANPNIIRIPINADSLLDVQHSYLQFKLNFTAANTRGVAPDIGVPFIRRLRIESAGTTLEDIEEYGKLYGGVLLPAQASVGAVQDSSISTGGIGAVSGNATIVAGALANTAATAVAAPAASALAGVLQANIEAGINAATADIKAKVDTALTALANSVNTQTSGVATIAGASALAGVKHQITSAFHGGQNITYNIPLVSALMNMDKYLPLVMMNAGLTLELELDVAGSLGLQDTNGAAGAGAGDEAPEWTISDVRYVAHLIDLQRDFYDKMRMVMEGSGGVLQLAGTTFRHYVGSVPAGADADATINIPSRVKSIKSVFFTQTPVASKTNLNEFGVSNSIPNGISEFQFRIGSVVYPPTSVKLGQGTLGGPANSYPNKGEAYAEFRKAFGTLGDYSEGGTMLNNESWFAAGTANDNTCAAGNAVPPVPKMCPLGLDFEAFPKTALESGVNTADRSLPMSLEIKRSGANAAVVCNCDVWVMCDAIFYVNLDGSVSVSI